MDPNSIVVVPTNVSINYPSHQTSLVPLKISDQGVLPSLLVLTLINIPYSNSITKKIQEEQVILGLLSAPFLELYEANRK